MNALLVDAWLPLCHQASRLACCPCGHAVSRMTQTPVVIVVLVVLSMGLALLCQAQPARWSCTLDLPRPSRQSSSGFFVLVGKQAKRQNYLRSLSRVQGKPTPAFA